MSFTNAVVRAGRAFVAAKDSDPEIEGRVLADYLLSDDPLGANERALLADLVLGNWRASKGRQPVKWGRKAEVVQALRAHEAELGPRMKETAKADIAERFSLKIETVRSYLREVEERERIQTKFEGAKPPIK